MCAAAAAATVLYEGGSCKLGNNIYIYVCKWLAYIFLF